MGGDCISGSIERVADFWHSGQDCTRASMSFDTPGYHTEDFTIVESLGNPGVFLKGFMSHFLRNDNSCAVQQEIITQRQFSLKVPVLPQWPTRSTIAN